jgi:hypothetical protein
MGRLCVIFDQGYVENENQITGVNDFLDHGYWLYSELGTNRRYIATCN